MYNRHEIKGNLARLLATENLVVQHKAVPTASFDVLKRVLTLPIWKDITNDIYDLLVGHEVGHALFTPNEDMHIHGVPQDYINIVEDVRIEKMMKRKYSGLNKCFYRGYQQLHDRDFFEISDRDLGDLSLPDRINVHYKGVADVPFETPAEINVCKMIADCETFSDVVSAAQELYRVYKEGQETKQNAAPMPLEGSQGGSSALPHSDASEGSEGDSSEEGDSNSSESTESYEDEGLDYDDQTVGAGEQGSEIETTKSLEQALQNLARTESYAEVDYIEVPEIKYEKLVVTNEDFISRCGDHYADAYPQSVEECDKRFAEFRKQSQREVNYLVKEFECKKSAAAYARAQTSRTGVLDTAKLHTYKYNEDLFKKVTLLPDGKNHGLVALVDWSGSIAPICLDIVKQLAQIAWFCKKCQIPFNAYLFSTEWGGEMTVTERTQAHKYAFHDNVRLINCITTETRNFEDQLKYLFRLGAFFQAYDGSYRLVGYSGLGYPLGLRLGGTPLSEAIVGLHAIIPYMKQKFGVEKLNVIVLTDGESHAGAYTTTHKSYKDESIYGIRSVENRAALRNRTTGRTYSPFTNCSLTNIKIWVEDVKETFSNTNILYFRIVPQREASRWLGYAAQYCDIKDIEALKKKFGKDKTAILGNGLGYDKAYVLSVKSLHASDDFVVPDSPTKTQIKNAFKKSLGGAKVKKKILSSFIEMVA